MHPLKVEIEKSCPRITRINTDFLLFIINPLTLNRLPFTVHPLPFNRFDDVLPVMGIVDADEIQSGREGGRIDELSRLRDDQTDFSRNGEKFYLRDQLTALQGDEIRNIGWEDLDGCTCGFVIYNGNIRYLTFFTLADIVNSRDLVIDV